MADDLPRLVVTDAAADLPAITAAFSAAGWTVLAADDGTVPALMLLALDAAGLARARAIRERDDELASVPIVALCADGTVEPPAGIDDVVPRTSPPRRWAALAEAWRPDGDAALDRLEASFGAAPIRAMTAQLRVILAEALDAPDGDDPTMLAHRLAGVAGTLGFAAAGAAWRSVSEGDDAARAAARRETRRAIATIDRRAIAQRRSTSV